MCGTLGPGELIVLAFFLWVVFSASRMAALGNALGKFVHSFRKGSHGQGFVDGAADRKAIDVKLEPPAPSRPPPDDSSRPS